MISTFVINTTRTNQIDQDEVTKKRFTCQIITHLHPSGEDRG